MTDAPHDHDRAHAAATRIKDAVFGRFGVHAVGLLPRAGGVVVTCATADPADFTALRTHLDAAAAATGVTIELRREPAFAA